MWKTLGLVILLGVFHQGLGETGCPDAEDIQPCVCTNSPFTYLLCQNISDGDVLKSVFANSTRYTYNEVHIEYSVMQYLPSNMFESVEVHEIHLKNVTLSNLFDRPPQALDKLWKLHIEDCRVARGIFWRILEPLKSLKILDVYFNSIKTLGDDFSQYAPRGLEQLTFYATETKSIKPGVFTNFTKLDKIAVDASKLTTLTRDIFPRPFNGRAIFFNDNKLTNIPEDMFRDMPNLQTLSLRKNEIATLPKEAFDSPDSVARIEWLMLDDNPIKCDCLLVWLMDVKPKVLQGKCISPKKLAGKELQEIEKSDFNC